MRGTKTQSESSIGSVRAEILARTDLVGAELRVALTSMWDDWLSGLLPDRPGIALVAVGGLGRREPVPFGDLDLVLLHDGSRASGRDRGANEVNEIADQLWYPIWDAGIGLDHSVRTPEEAVAVADQDLKATLGLLEARHLAGDRALSAAVREQVTTRWIRNAPARLAELQDLARTRWATRGDASFLLEPDLKDCRGGLRDWVGLRALASAQLVNLTVEVTQASTALLDVRSELHRAAGRAADVMRAQDREPLAQALGLADADAVLRTVNLSARALGFATDSAWRRVTGAYAVAPRSWLRKFRTSDQGAGAPNTYGQRTPLAADVIAQAGEVVLARDADPAADPVLMLRVARAAAQHDLPIADHALRRLATESAPMPVPWPTQAREEFVTILGTGARCVAALEALDQQGLLSRLIPQWESVRCRAQHNPVHQFTVDRHLLEAVVKAVAFAAEVARPDLLLMAAFLHDIGKGYPGDHSAVGAELTTDIASRLGYPEREVRLLAHLTKHHLLLPDTATRRDLEDPSTIAIVTSAVGESSEALELLHYLCIADATATGPAAWSDWKAGLVAELVRKTHAVMRGEPMPESAPIPAQLLELASDGRAHLVIDGAKIAVLAPDGTGLLSRAAGLLAVHSLDVQSADVRTVGSMAVNSFVVAPRFGQIPSSELLQSELHRVLAGTLAVDEKLRDKASRYEQNAVTGSVRLKWLDNEATEATILEVRAPNRIGLLHWVAAALEDSGLDIRSARICSLGGFVVDSFYVTDTDGKPLTQARQDEVADALLAVLSTVTAPG